MEDELPASHATVGADGARDLGAIVLWPEVTRVVAHGVNAGPVRPVSDLSNDRPAVEQLAKHHSV